jgi:hypothetical protein
MAMIHHTTLTPGKLELLTQWLPDQPWYRGAGAPVLTKAGGFRLDDPAGDVGIELMIVADALGDRYLVPMTYRGAPLADADDALLGTAEHGVLGRRWIYDGARDPVAVEQLLALAAGQVDAQHQNVSNTVDDCVRPSPTLTRPAAAPSRLSVVDTATGTAVALEPDGLALHIVRVLTDETVPRGRAVAAVEADVPQVGRRPVLLVVEDASGR